MRNRRGFPAALLIALSLATSTPATAGTLTRAWVSSLGTDGASCGAVATPCRTFNGALANVAPGAEIDVKDPGDYGPAPVTISHGVSIVNDGVGTAAVRTPAGANAFTINVPAADAVELRGLSINGGGAAGTNGVVFNGGGGLTIIDCVIERFASTTASNGNAIQIAPASGSLKVLIAGSKIVDNGNIGVNYVPSGTVSAIVSIERTVIRGLAQTSKSAGVTALTSGLGGSLALNISNAVISNYYYGANISGNAATVVTVAASQLNNNGIGIIPYGQEQVLIKRSVISGNNTGVDVCCGTGAYDSAGDNVIRGNVTNVIGTLTKIGTQ